MKDSPTITEQEQAAVDKWLVSNKPAGEDREYVLPTPEGFTEILTVPTVEEYRFQEKPENRMNFIMETPEGFEESKAPNKYGFRLDGSPKGTGFLGELKRPDGKISTELSIGVELDGQEVQVPSLVPTLNETEISHLLSGKKPTKTIINKAVQHARDRINEGKSHFYGGETDDDTVWISAAPEERRNPVMESLFNPLALKLFDAIGKMSTKDWETQREEAFAKLFLIDNTDIPNEDIEKDWKLLISKEEYSGIKTAPSAAEVGKVAETAFMIALIPVIAVALVTSFVPTVIGLGAFVILDHFFKLQDLLPPDTKDEVKTFFAVADFILKGVALGAGGKGAAKLGGAAIDKFSAMKLKSLKLPEKISISVDRGFSILRNLDGKINLNEEKGALKILGLDYQSVTQAGIDGKKITITPNQIRRARKREGFDKIMEAIGADKASKDVAKKTAKAGIERAKKAEKLAKEEQKSLEENLTDTKTKINQELKFENKIEAPKEKPVEKKLTKEVKVQETVKTKVEKKTVKKPVSPIKKNKLGVGVEKKAVEKGLVDEFKGLPEYEKVNMKKQAEAVANLLKESPEKAYAIALGLEKPPEGIIPEMVFVAVEKSFLKNKDALGLEGLANSALVDEATIMGQRIRALRDRNEYSPVRVVKKVKDDLVKIFEQKTEMDAKPIAKEEAQDLVKEFKKVKNKIKSTAKRKAKGKAVEEWKSFIEKVKC